MRKSGWTVATALSSLALLLTACGGSSTSTSTTGAPSGTPTQGTATASSSSSSGPAVSATSSPKSTAKAKATSSSSSPKQTAQAQPSGDAGVTLPPIGTTVLIVMHSNLGWVMATAKGLVVYTYGKDSKGGPPTCTGSCAEVWAPVTGAPEAGPADNFPGTFGVITAGGKKVITYDGYPLYTFVGAPPLSTKGNGLGGEWHVIILSAGDISGA